MLNFIALDKELFSGRNVEAQGHKCGMFTEFSNRRRIALLETVWSLQAKCAVVSAAPPPWLCYGTKYAAICASNFCTSEIVSNENNDLMARPDYSIQWIRHYGILESFNCSILILHCETVAHYYVSGAHAQLLTTAYGTVGYHTQGGPYIVPDIPPQISLKL